MRVLLDANALLAPVRSGLRLFEELDRVVGPAEPAVPGAVVGELERLADGRGQTATAAGVGLDLVDRCVVLDHAASHADDAIVELAPAVDAVVTNDAALRERLHAAGVRVIGLRGRTTLATYERTDA